MLRIYQLLILILLPVVVLRLIYRSIREPAYRAHLVERFGWVGDYPTRDVWIHAFRPRKQRGSKRHEQGNHQPIQSAQPSGHDKRVHE